LDNIVYSNDIPKKAGFHGNSKNDLATNVQPDQTTTPVYARVVAAAYA
jgi:hypothetical protein